MSERLDRTATLSDNPRAIDQFEALPNCPRPSSGQSLKLCVRAEQLQLRSREVSQKSRTGRNDRAGT